MKSCASLLILAATAAVARAGGAVFSGNTPLAPYFNQAFGSLAAAGEGGGFGDMAVGFFKHAFGLPDALPGKRHPAEELHSLGDHNPLPDQEYRWIPLFQDALDINNKSATVTLPSRCFKQNVFAITSVNDTSIDISVTVSGKNFTLLCDEMWLFGTVSTASLLKVSKQGVHTVTVARNDANPAGAGEWLQREGVRIFKFLENEVATGASLLATAELYVPALTEKILDDKSAARNVKFVKNYANITNIERAEWAKGNNGWLGLNLTHFQSGDVFVIAREDGLGTLEDWGTGAGSTHIAMTWRFKDNPDMVFVIESTDTTSYWPNPNVQKTELGKWLGMAESANYSIAWLPLKPEMRAQIDEESAEEWIAYMLGQPYGYATFLFTFIDTPRDNLPWPATPEAIEVAFSWVELFSPAAAAKIFTRALNKRVGTTGRTIAECSNKAAAQGLSFGELMAIPEQDTWVYDDGVNYVCDSFACSVLKHAGLFGSLGDQINCVEFTNRAMYSSNFYDTSLYPDICNTADPEVPYCMILGRYALDLRPFNVMAPYAHMEEHCPGLPLGYERTPGC